MCEAYVIYTWSDGTRICTTDIHYRTDFMAKVAKDGPPVCVKIDIAVPVTIAD